MFTKRIGFGNETSQVTTVVYEVKCHPAYYTIVKSLLTKASVLDPLPPSDTNIHFIPRGLIQSTDATTVKNHFTQQNHFLAQKCIVQILNTMNAGTNNRIKKTSTRHTTSNWYRTHVFDRIFRKMASIN